MIAPIYMQAVLCGKLTYVYCVQWLPWFNYLAHPLAPKLHIRSLERLHLKLCTQLSSCFLSSWSLTTIPF